jgi:nucleotide-binding universal stress UspA family protein
VTVQQILVPTDFSEYAEQALAYAIELAQAFQARLTLLHIIDTASWGIAQAEAMLPPSYWQELETGIAESMAEPLARVHAAGLEGEAAIARGIPFQTIIDTAREKRVDLIVMGTHGRTGLIHALMGSVAEKVVRLAPCPVLVTRRATEDATAQ